MKTNKEILTKAILKALKNGFAHHITAEVSDETKAEILMQSHQPDSIIFDHDFAKAFWGKELILEEYPLSDGSGEYLKIWMPAWQAHLRKMVLEEDPIKYLEKFV